MYTAITQKLLAKTSSKHMQKTQYGFGQYKNTVGAVQMVGWIAKHRQLTKKKLHIASLDWEKAFDKVDRERLFEALDRMSVNPKYIHVIKTFTTIHTI